MMIAESVKPTVEWFLARGGPAGIVRRMTGRRDTVLAFHNVVPDGIDSGGDDALHLSWSRFRSHLDVLEEEYEVVSLARILDEPDSGTDGPPRVAVTFDDAYRGALIIALPELVERRLPVTVFVSPGLVGSGRFWWDDVSEPEGEPLRGLSRQVALNRFRGDGRRIMSWARRCGFGEGGVNALARAGRLSELDRAAELPGVSFGAHGWWHRNLTALGPTHLSGELDAPLAWLQERYACAIPVLAYPYGKMSPRVAAAAARAGYRAAFLSGGGRLPPTSNGDGVRSRMSLPRLSVPRGLSPDGLRLRLAGILEG